MNITTSDMSAVSTALYAAYHALRDAHESKQAHGDADGHGTLPVCPGCQTCRVTMPLLQREIDRTKQLLSRMQEERRATA